jgi:hypothetical protein
LYVLGALCKRTQQKSGTTLATAPLPLRRVCRT